MPYLKQSGRGLIEVLLVVVVIAGLTLFSVERYRQYTQLTAVANIRADVAAIFQALNDYFKVQGCDPSGVFVGNIAPDIDSDLNLSRLVVGHSPWVMTYVAHFVADPTLTPNQKPTYQLQVTAVLHHAVSAAVIDRYAAALDARTDEQRSTLTWTTLPFTQANQGMSPYWILAGSAAQFRQQTNGVIANVSANCAQ